MENENSPWVQTGDTLYEPSNELITRIRQNPEKFPHAVDDLATLSGKSREEVEDILNNPTRDGGMFDSGLVGAGNRLTGAAVRGVGQAVGWAAEKLFGVDHETVEQATNFDPGFSTEKSVTEQLGEVAGQAVPAIGAALAAGPGGAIAAGVAGAGTATLTFSDQDNIANMVDDWEDGLAPDFLVINPEDSQEVATLKNLGSNLIVDLGLAGMGSAIAKVYRVFRDVPTGLAGLPDELSAGTHGLQQELQRIADEAGVPVRSEPGNPATAQKAVEQVARDAAEEVVEAPVKRERALTAAARDKVADDILVREVGHDTKGRPAGADPIPQAIIDEWHQNTLNPVARLLNRSHETNVGRRGTLASWEEGAGAAAYREISEQALRAAYDSNLVELRSAISRIDDLKDTVHANQVFRDSVLRSAMEMVDSRFTQIIELIRKDPTLKTREAMKMVADDYQRVRVALQETYRETGSSSAYAFLVRKGVKFPDALKAPLKEAEEKMAKEMKDNGMSLFATEAEFKAAHLLSYDEMGFDTLAVLDELDAKFRNFDLARQGSLDNFRRNKLARLSNAEREMAEASFLRWLNDMHASALLGQPSTSGMEALTNSLNVLVLPMLRHFTRRGGQARAFREYAGYIAEWQYGWKHLKASIKAGRGTTDDFDIKDAQLSKAKGWMNRDYGSLQEQGKTALELMYRMWDFASSLSIGATEGTKAIRYASLAYADGFELALKSGMTKPQAKRAAKQYVASKFNPDGSFNDAALKLDVAQGFWQGNFDTRTVTGKIAQEVDNLRNSQNIVVSVLARSAVPFWRTLINIGSNSMQYIQPIPSAVLQPLAKTKWGGNIIGATKFLDDFSGRNGLMAQYEARGRQRIGAAMMGATWALMETGAIDITGPASLGRWETKMAEGREYPPSSLIVGGKAFDLTRLLPFSAPLLLMGVLKDVKRDQELRMKDGNYVAEDSSIMKVAGQYGTALGILTYSMLFDLAAMRGMGDLFDTISTGLTEGIDPRALIDQLEDYGKQFTPGAVRAVGKNQGLWTGEWSQHAAEGFLNEALASAGWPSGYERWDFLGRPIDDDWFRGIDPLNTKPIRTDDTLVNEYVLLNKTGDLGLSLDRPDRVFGPAYWKGLGVQPGWIDTAFRNEAPSLFQMETVDGQNAWGVYRQQVYHQASPKDVTVSTASHGADVGKVPILKGENYEAAMRRTVASPDYETLTPTGRVAVWKAVFGHFKKQAKDYVKDNVVVDPSIFDGSKYGAPTNAPATLSEVEEAAKSRASEVHKTRSIPLNDIFRIK